jgi:hypothetical protein
VCRRKCEYSSCQYQCIVTDDSPTTRLQCRHSNTTTSVFRVTATQVSSSATNITHHAKVRHWLCVCSAALCSEDAPFRPIQANAASVLTRQAFNMGKPGQSLGKEVRTCVWPIPKGPQRSMGYVTRHGWVRNPRLAPNQVTQALPSNSDQLSLYAAVWAGAILYFFASSIDFAAFFEVSGLPGDGNAFAFRSRMFGVETRGYCCTGLAGPGVRSYYYD